MLLGLTILIKFICCRVVHRPASAERVLAYAVAMVMVLLQSSMIYCEYKLQKHLLSDY